MTEFRRWSSARMLGQRMPGLCAAVFVLLVPTSVASEAAPSGTLHDAREVHLADVRQLTFGGENAEAYWSFDGSELIYQASGGDYACDQIFRMDPNLPGERSLVSSGTGRTTCAYFLPGDEDVVYATTHLADAACPAPPDRSMGYVWPIYPTYEIVRTRPDGSALRQLTDNDAYDAEATVCGGDGAILFTSTRDGDLELYRMDADGANVRRLTDTPGYDGGAFFNADCSKIVWRASRPKGAALADYERLLARGLVRPSKLEIFVADADGSNAQQVTYLGAASFAPFFHPDGQSILFSTNHHSENGREFDIFSVRVDGSKLERITYTPGFDGFPMFSPDGRTLAFGSNRNQGKPGETDVYVARWIDTTEEARLSAIDATPADRFRADVGWLADDAREGRGVGTEGLDAAARFLADRFASLGLAAAGDPGEGADGRSFLQAFEVAVDATRGDRTKLIIDGAAVAAEHFVPAGFSANGSVSGSVVAVGYGISAPELGHDDYAHVDVTGKIVAVRRFVPESEAFSDNKAQRRFGDLRHKAFTAREQGAVGLLVVDLPEASGAGEVPEEAPLPRLAVSTAGRASLPAAVIDRASGAVLLSGEHQVEIVVEIVVEHASAHNVVARVEAATSASSDETMPAKGPIIIGAHYDHLGFGGHGSLAPDEHVPHNGADDNASGTAALLEIARQLVARRQALQRDVWLVAFSGEETGLLGSTHFTKEPPAGLRVDDVMAMINLDMVGRLRERLSVLGAASAEEWQEVVQPACDALGIACVLGGDGYGPSDQTPFYAAGIPVLHLFTGTHEDYHRPSDDTVRINAVGGARVASLASDIATRLAQRPEPLTYVTAEAPAPMGDTRSYGASLGTVPDYADDSGGVLLAGVRPGSAAEEAGIKRGDRLVALAGKDIGDIYDFMYILRESKPGESVVAVVERAGARVELEVTFGESTSLR